MSRPGSRSPMRLYRSSPLYRRSLGRCEDRRYAGDLPADTMDVDLRRGSRDRGGQGRVSLREAGWYRQEGQGTKFGVDPADSRRYSPSDEYTDRRDSPVPRPELGYAERRRLSPRRCFGSPGSRSSSGGGGGGGGRKRRRAERAGNVQSFPKDGRGITRERLASPAAPYDARQGRRVSPPRWDRSDRGNSPMEGQEWSPNRAPGAARGHSPRVGPFTYAGRREKMDEDQRFSDGCHRSHSNLERHRAELALPGCALESGFVSRRHSSERPQDRRRPGLHRMKESPEPARVIVEHDHGIVGHETSWPAPGLRQEYHHGRDHDHRPLPRRSPEDYGSGFGMHRRTEADAGSRSSLQRLDSSSLGGRRRGMVPTQPGPQDCFERPAPEAKGDVDLRHVGSNQLARKKVSRPDPVRPDPVKPGRKRKGKTGQKKPPKGNLGPHLAAAVRAPEQESLTIKVDVGRLMAQNSQSACSSERQLSLDLINVGRQRLDFLPTLEHSGSQGEAALHSGTFAQEIITLVHQVKENYFKGSGLTLNERFSAQSGQLEERQEEGGPLFNRRIAIDPSQFKTLEVFKKGGRKQKLRKMLADDPGDLRHDLERRRQERLEEVKVTIPGTGLLQRPLVPGSAPGEPEPLPEDEEGSFTCPSWTGGSLESGRWRDQRPGYVRQSPGRGLVFGSQARRGHLKTRVGERRPQNQRGETGASW